jgi:hypothetical protein
MRGLKFREMLHAKPFRPFFVKTTDGDTFLVHHPDFAMVSPGNKEVAIFDPDDHFRLVAMNHIVTLEPQRNGSRKPGKR